MKLSPESGLMTLCRSLGLESIAWPLRRFHCPVSRDALVLEVGSGGNPYARANVLLDAYETSRERHWAPLKADRPTVLGFAENLPFRDKAFDFVIASHVLEHSAEPERFLAELQRVARAGYIETPDAFMERINPYRDHRLEVTCRQDSLLIRKKAAWVADPELVELYEHAAKIPVARRLIPAQPFDFHLRFYWENKISFTVVNPEVDSSWAPPSDLAPPGQRSDPGIKQSILDGLRYLLSQTARNRALDLASLLRCPRCHNSRLQKMSGQLVCENCAAEYPVRNGIPILT